MKIKNYKPISLIPLFFLLAGSLFLSSFLLGPTKNAQAATAFSATNVLGQTSSNGQPSFSKGIMFNANGKMGFNTHLMSPWTQYITAYLLEMVTVIGS